jgi:glycosyltransferase involved in cell wall biosynthesis
MKISLVTHFYNRAKYIEKTIQSVLNQSYKDIEYIIIDGGSTDGTLKIIEKYQDKLAYFVSEPDSGMYDAIRKGFKVASGDICAYINSDDFYINNKV